MNLSNKKILITGADGFIGSHLTEMLVQKGVRVKDLSYYNSFNLLGLAGVSLSQEKNKCKKELLF